MKVFEMDSLEDVPSKKLVPEGADSWMMEDSERQRLLHSLVNELIKTFFAGEYQRHSAVDDICDDKVFLYSKYLLSLGFFYCEYCDAIREGDGSRVLRCWRYMLPMFISSGRRNYAVESMHLLMQHDYLLSPREAAELVWSRFVNVHGCPGQNIPNDLHMEHLNRMCKNAMKGLGANKTPQSISRISNALGTIIPILDSFDDNNCIALSSGNHNPKDATKDLMILVDVLQKAFVFTKKGKRFHPSFSKPRNPLRAIANSDLTKWMVDHIHFQ